MIIIITKNEQKYWTDEYSELDGFLVFETTTKTGKIVKHEVNKSEVAEIVKNETEL